MKFFFIHDEAGCIHQAGQCADDELEIQHVPEGMTLQEGEASPFTCYFDGDEVIAKPVRPSPMHAWDWATKAWADPRTLNDLKLAKWQTIRQARDKEESTSFPYLGKQVQSDIVSVLRINTAVKAAEYAQAHGAPFSTHWRCADNSLLALDGPAMQMMPVALAAYSQSLHSRTDLLRNQIEAATTASEIDNINWATNG